MASTGRALSLARSLGDLSSLTDAIGAPAGPGRRLWARGIVSKVGRFQMGLGVFGLAGMVILLNTIDSMIKKARAENLYVGTAVKYANILNDGSAHHKASHWMDKAQARAQKKIQQGGFEYLFGEIAKPPNLSGGISRSTLYQGQQFVNDITAFASAGIVSRLASRAAGVASARLFFGTLMHPEINPNMVPALIYQKELIKSCRDHGHVDTGCLVNSIAIGRTRGEMLRKSAQGCLVAANASGEDRSDVLSSKAEMLRVS